MRYRTIQFFSTALVVLVIAGVIIGIALASRIDASPDAVPTEEPATAVVFSPEPQATPVTPAPVTPTLQPNGGPGTREQAPSNALPPGVAPPGYVVLLAKIDAATVEDASMPGRHVLRLTVGQPTGCTEPDGFTYAKNGNEIGIKVYQTVPEGHPWCTDLYKTYEVSIGLGVDLEAGQQYHVDVNGMKLSFVA